MTVLRRLVYREVSGAVALVTLAFLGLFFFFDFIDELGAIGRPSPIDPKTVYQLKDALLQVALQVPSHAYEVLPIAVLIGAIFVFARLAQGSEYTILRTSGLGPWRALRMMLGLGLVFVSITFVVGDYLAPAAGKAAQLQKAQFQGRVNVGGSGAWLKEKQAYSQYSVNVLALNGRGELEGIRIFEFDNQGRLVSRTQAQTGRIDDEGGWLLQQVQRTELAPGGNGAAVQQRTLPSLLWPNSLTAEMVSVALLRPERMPTADLYRYVQHLDTNGQSSQRYELEFWRKVFYPLSCLVMVVLALPFAYLHFRSGGITGYVFGGVMIGISFFLLNNVFGYIGNLNNWLPWLAAASPSLIYSLVSLTAFGWLVLRR
ncbi:MAG: LPS export ABC transporter permease LptG [Burkholderiaceae bacterium]